MVRTPPPEVKRKTEEQVFIFAANSALCSGSRSNEPRDPSHPSSLSLRWNREQECKCLVVRRQMYLGLLASVVVIGLCASVSFSAFSKNTEEGIRRKRSICVQELKIKTRDIRTRVTLWKKKLVSILEDPHV